MFRTEICIAGAGIIGLSLAIELHSRGLQVTVVDLREPMQEASTAAAGMLAVEDPHNPTELWGLSNLSIGLYPAFLDRMEHLSGIGVPFQTRRTLQAIEGEAVVDSKAVARFLGDEQSLPPGFKLLQEYSIDPRQLAASLLGAVDATSVHLLAHERVIATEAGADSISVSTSVQKFEAEHFVDCTGAWARDPAYHVVPIKGQMLAVALPYEAALTMPIRTRDFYVVPRTVGPNAGCAIIGATVEDAGFDKTVHTAQIDELHRRASGVVPLLAYATITESWSGLRPATPDRLPILGAHPTRPRRWVATGHYRNGILLAPATAQVMAQLILGDMSEVSLDAFSPSRNAVRR